MFKGGGASHGPENPDLDWFQSGTIDVSKLNRYVLSPLHPTGHHKARAWSSIFGLGQGDEELLADLIREQLVQVEQIEERPPKAHVEDPAELTRRWTLFIPQFRGPNGNVARVRTLWALAPGKDKPHLASALPDPTRQEVRRYKQEQRRRG
jgi:hypothetical protein